MRGIVRAVAAGAFCCLAAKLPAVDYGLLSEGQGRFVKSGASSYSGAGRLSLWGSFDGGSGFRGFANLSAAADSASSLANPLGFFDVSALRLDLDMKLAEGAVGQAALSLGRFDFGDPTGFVLAHRADGLALKVSAAGFSIAAQAAWLGIQPKSISRIFLSAADAADYADSTVLYAPSRAVGLLSFRVPEILPRQDATAFLAGQLDFRKDATKRFDSGYGGLSFRGAIASGMYWNAYGVGEYSSEGFACLAGASLEYLKKAESGPNARFDLLFASGDNGPIRPYKPISSTSLGETSGIWAANIAMAALSGGWKFSEAFKTEAKAASYLRASASPLAIEGFDASSSKVYVGSEISLGLTLRPLSDLSLSGMGGLFFPNAGGSFKSGSPNVLRLRIDAGIAL